MTDYESIASTERMVIIASTLLAALPVVLLFGIFIILDIALRLSRWDKRRHKRRSPLTGQLLRGPGESLRNAIDILHSDVSAHMFTSIIWPVFIYSVYISEIHYGSIRATPLPLSFFAIVGVGVCVYEQKKAFRLRREIDALRKGLDAEIAVGQELNELLREGFWVFHDVPGDGFNVDHVVVGRTGVFAVETKARKKPTTDNRTADAHVEYDGSCLRFPDWTDKKSVAQASAQAKWLALWLRDSTGDKAIQVRPVLALPGWFVTRTANLEKETNPVIVMNPKNPKYLACQKATLSASQVRRIVHQLDCLCRDIEPYEAGKGFIEKENGLTKKIKGRA